MYAREKNKAFMVKWIAKIALLVVLLVVTTSTSFANSDQENAKQKSDRKKVERVRRVAIHKVLKSADPELIYSEALKYYGREKWRQAGDLFDACMAYYVGDVREDSTAFFSARSKFKNRDYVNATTQLDEFRRKFGRSVFIEDSEAMLAMCHYYLAPDPTRDQTITGEAIIAFSEFIERYPNSKRVEAFKNLIEELTLRLKKKAYLNAYTYYKIGRYKSAIVAFKNAMKRYPDSHRTEEMMYYSTVSAYKLAANSVESKQLDRYLAMLDHYYSFIGEYPESKHIKELDRMAKDARNYIDKNRKTEDNV